MTMVSDSPAQLYSLDSEGNLCDEQGLPVPMSVARIVASRIDTALRRTTPHRLADTYNQRLRDRGGNYEKQFSVTGEAMQ